LEPVVVPIVASASADKVSVPSKGCTKAHTILSVALSEAAAYACVEVVYVPSLKLAAEATSRGIPVASTIPTQSP
ncbi:hypothetical protein KKA87_10960, partial [bacterium]|nr:hypothetical protein [bacterium]